MVGLGIGILNFRESVNRLGGGDDKGRGIELKVVEMKIGDLWIVMKVERELRGEEKLENCFFFDF